MTHVDDIRVMTETESEYKLAVILSVPKAPLNPGVDKYLNDANLFSFLEVSEDAFEDYIVDSVNISPTTSAMIELVQGTKSQKDLQKEWIDNVSKNMKPPFNKPVNRDPLQKVDWANEYIAGFDVGKGEGKFEQVLMEEMPNGDYLVKNVPRAIGKSTDAVEKWKNFNSSFVQEYMGELTDKDLIVKDRPRSMGKTNDTLTKLQGEYMKQLVSTKKNRKPEDK